MGDPMAMLKRALTLPSSNTVRRRWESWTLSCQGTRLNEAARAGIQPTLPLPASGLMTPSHEPESRTTHIASGEPNSVRVVTLA